MGTYRSERYILINHQRKKMISLSRSLLKNSRSTLKCLRIQNQPVKHLANNVDIISDTTNSLVISDTAVERLNQIVEGNGWLRVAVEGGGCSGFQYKLDLEAENEGHKVTEDDVVMEKRGAKVVVDKESLEYLGGATVDYHVEPIRAGFRVVSNPKAEGGCSCGASFNIKIDL